MTHALQCFQKLKVTGWQHTSFFAWLSDQKNSQETPLLLVIYTISAT